MFDPFPFRANPLLSDFTHGIASKIYLQTLSLHIHEVILSALAYHIVCVFVSPYLSSRIFPRTYPSLPWRTKLNWDVHVVSLVQSIMICSLAFYTLINDDERNRMDYRERIWGYTGATGLIDALATGYFAWDLYMSATHIGVFGLGLLAHASCALLVYLLGFRPFVNYYAPSFILYELSSPFLNFHWFFDKLNMTGSNAQLYNGILLMSTFFGSRLIWGTYASFHCFSDVWKALKFQDTPAGKAWLETRGRSPALHFDRFTKGDPAAELFGHTTAHPRHIPQWLALAYVTSNLVLLFLNVIWFGKMIETIRKRFAPPFGTRQPEPEKDIAVSKDVDGRGVMSVKLDAKEARQRKKENTKAVS